MHQYVVRYPTNPNYKWSDTQFLVAFPVLARCWPGGSERTSPSAEGWRRRCEQVHWLSQPKITKGWNFDWQNIGIWALMGSTNKRWGYTISSQKWRDSGETEIWPIKWGFDCLEKWIVHLVGWFGVFLHYLEAENLWWNRRYSLVPGCALRLSVMASANCPNESWTTLDPSWCGKAVGKVGQFRGHGEETTLW